MLSLQRHPLLSLVRWCLNAAAAAGHGDGMPALLFAAPYPLMPAVVREM